MELFLTISLLLIGFITSIGLLKNKLRKKARGTLHTIMEPIDTYIGPLSEIQKDNKILYICSGQDQKLIKKTQSENILFYDLEHKQNIKSNRIEQITGTMNHLSLKDEAIDTVYLQPVEHPIFETTISEDKQYLNLCNEIDRVLKDEGEIILNFEWGKRYSYRSHNLHQPLNEYHDYAEKITEFFKSKGYTPSTKMLNNYIILKKEQTKQK